MTDSANPKRRNLWKILFGISLALNLLIVGALGGAFMRKGLSLIHISEPTRPY